MNNNKKNILIRGVNWIGDAVLTLPAIQSLRSAWPDAHISLLVKPWVRDIYEHDTSIDEIITYEDFHRGVRGKLALVKQLKRKKFDIAVLFQNAFDAALITWLAGIPERIGYRTDHRGFLLTKAVNIPKEILSCHQVYYYLNLIKSIGIDAVCDHPYLKISPDERENAKNILSFNESSGGPLVGINPGATYGPAKRWLPERFAELIYRVITEMDGRVVIFGSASERRIADEVTASLEEYSKKGGRHKAEGIREKTEGGEQETKDRTYSGEYTSRILNLAGRTSLRELIAGISLCDAFVTNDSGPMHIASALFIPTVAVFGSTNVKTTGPYGEGHRIVSRNLECAPCLERECPDGHYRCITEVSSENVFNALKELLDRSAAVFIDRDGTIIEDKHYLNRFDDLEIFPESKDAIDLLHKHNYKVIGITNQSGIARGLIEENFVLELNDYIREKLGVDDFFYCPHHPDDRCICRKPETLMIQLAKLRHRIDLTRSYMIGDMESDMLLAKASGIKGILIAPEPTESTTATHIVRNIMEAAEWIVKTSIRGLSS